ncbi:DUF4446 family protein [Sporomusa termitida]|uniref:DUF4446 family protein n=1 Tax=Sporomusa termitida TaxID=2377 RepID=A0A517E0P7_9FIRM|nr:DUF4446 family protein [Sporomusa termitida]QDR83076.1 hypothetical protein SPTER_45480 [Sporomusa termitida]
MSILDISQYTVFITTNLPYILLVLTVLIFLALIVFININRKLSRLTRRYKKMMAGMEGINIERLLVQHVEEVRLAVDKVNRLEGECRRLATVTAASIQYVGVVRFNAFEDTGSDLSFALALLDGSKTGVVLSSIYGRNESRVYAKPITKGESAYYLTDEEKGALNKALGKNS